MKLRTLIAVAIATVAAFTASAAEPTGYYDAAHNKNQQALLTALYNIVGSHNKVSYDGLWEAYKTTDVTTDGKYYWDMYATTKYPLGEKHCGNYSAVGDCVNREHSFPKSWWGGGSANQYSDLFHLYPTDGFVNNQRSNYPFGECANGTYLPTNGTNKPLGKLGNCTYSGYTGKVFEPDDEYKGDFARSYFGLAAAYNNVISGWTKGEGSAMMAGNKYPVFTDWALNLLLDWHRLDPVSEKERNRNDAMYAENLQHNRNPFIDHPELVEYIWGNKKNELWTGSESSVPTLISPSAGNAIDFGTVANNTTHTHSVTVKGTALTKDLTVNVRGNGFSCPTTTLTASAVNSGTSITITFSAPATAQQSYGALDISSDEVNVSVSLTAQTVTGIPALAATEVTTSSFYANWTPMGDATTYSLSVLQDDGATPVSGYPKNVTASTGKYLVSGLQPNTTYYYQLSSATLTSNAVEVTTLEPMRVISIQTQEEFEITAELNAASPILEAQVYTEYVEEDITLTVTGNFEISLNKQEWAQSLNIDPDGEIFYVRIKSTAREGEFEGLLNACTATMDGADEEIVGYVIDPSSEPNSVTEGFEAIASGGYWNGNTVKQGDAYSWAFNNAGVWGQGSDNYNGNQSVRMRVNSTNGNGYIAMNEDSPSGASKISFYAKPFGSDNAATVVVSYSTNQGASWTQLKTFTVGSTNGSNAPARAAMAENNYYSADLDVKGNIRFKIEQTSGNRLNIDDVTITDARIKTNVVESITSSSRNWEAVPMKTGILVTASRGTTIEVYNLEAKRMAKVRVNGSKLVTLPAGIYVVTADGQSTKLIVK
ncbi:MAG: endonuclease [Muribaculaceae bacterium]|nr:endonuclease [Muribaculaceae bacterium]